MIRHALFALLFVTVGCGATAEDRPAYLEDSDVTLPAPVVCEAEFWLLLAASPDDACPQRKVQIVQCGEVPDGAVLDWRNPARGPADGVLVEGDCSWTLWLEPVGGS
jgi:hypothetical protein